jgi:hypothetical protein
LRELGPVSSDVLIESDCALVNEPEDGDSGHHLND